MKTLDYRSLPLTSANVTPLFLDYLYDFPVVEKYYNGDYRADEFIAAHTEKISSFARDRETLAQVLWEQAEHFQCGAKSRAHIELLRKENTFAVVTGQQVGIFSGPLYTLYKILTTIKLTEHLAEKYPDKNFVPIFWLEGEDHDFAEMSSVSVLTADNSFQLFQYLIGGIPQEKNYGAVGEIIFDFFFNECKATIFSTLLPTEFSAQMKEIFSTAYSDGVSFNAAFVALINALLEDSGLIFLSANDRRLKNLLLPLFKKEILEHPKSSQLVIERSAELEEKYHAQLKPRPVNLFLFHSDGRFAIDSIDEKFWLRGTRKYFSRDELLSILETSPEKFSPNVVLRPLCQETLLPTVAYIAGPSEIAYFAQLKPLYEYFSIPMPVIYPRASATIVEQRISNVLEKFHLSIEDFFRGKDDVVQRISQQLSAINIEEVFQGAEKEITNQLEQLREALQPIDATLVPAMENARNKMLFQLHSMKERATAATQKKHQTALLQIEKAFHSFLPNDNWQERELNIIYFLNKYGMDFLTMLKTELSPFIFHHQLIEMP